MPFHIVVNVGNGTEKQFLKAREEQFASVKAEIRGRPAPEGTQRRTLDMFIVINCCFCDIWPSRPLRLR